MRKYFNAIICIIAILITLTGCLNLGVLFFEDKIKYGQLEDPNNGSISISYRIIGNKNPEVKSVIFEHSDGTIWLLLLTPDPNGWKLSVKEPGEKYKYIPLLFKDHKEVDALLHKWFNDYYNRDPIELNKKINQGNKETMKGRCLEATE